KDHPGRSLPERKASSSNQHQLRKFQLRLFSWGSSGVEVTICDLQLNVKHRVITQRSCVVGLESKAEALIAPLTQV
ncbi:uncharacterized protein METZ01_LOCUS247683, partial [marine metagenome]